MRITIIGVGSLGSLFAARLSTNNEITMVGTWREQIETIRKTGIKLIDPAGKEARRFPVITWKIEEVEKGDCVLILVKSWQTSRAAKQACEVVTDDGIVLTLQNGLGNLEILESIAGQNRSFLGVTSEGANLGEPGVVRHAGWGQTHLARKLNANQGLEKIAEVFQDSGFETHLVDDAQGLIWGKLAVNAGINPLTALLQVPNGYLVSTSLTRSLMVLAATEVESVASAMNIILPYESAAMRAIAVAQATAANRSSMAQDVARGTPTEIDSICLPVVEKGRRFAVPTPVNEALLILIRQQLATGDWRTALDRLPEVSRQKFSELAKMVSV